MYVCVCVCVCVCVRVCVCVCACVRVCVHQDLFKRMNVELRRQADAILSKANRATQFDIAKVQTN